MQGSTHDVSVYIQGNIPVPESYINELLPKEGVLLLFGSPKAGKSWLAMHMGFSLATGSEWLGFRVEQARTILVQFEISPRAYRFRLKKMARHYTMEQNRLYELSPGLTYLENTGNYNSLVELLTPIEPQVIVLDCLASCFGGDENNSRDMASFIETIENLKRQFNAAIVLVHHSRKSPAMTSFSELARGASRLTGWVDTMVHLTQQGTTQNSMQLQFLARQADREISVMNVQMENYSWTRR